VKGVIDIRDAYNSSQRHEGIQKNHWLEKKPSATARRVADELKCFDFLSTLCLCDGLLFFRLIVKQNELAYVLLRLLSGQSIAGKVGLSILPGFVCEKDAEIKPPR
jgi:hypothetical protein